MIRPLRQLHRRIVIALGVLLPITFVAGIAARKTAPMVADLPSALTPTSQAFEFKEWEREGLFAKSPVQVRLLREQKNAGRVAVTFSAVKDFVKPDLIVYWIAGEPAITDTLPANSILLGSFNSPMLPLPDEVVKASGTLILYSLANGEIVDVSKPISLQFLSDSKK